jgi:hypothetical protein
MSDALCRTAVLSRELHPLAFAPSALATCEATRLVTRRARTRRHAAWLGQQGHLTQDAFNWRELSLAAERAKPRSLDVHAAWRSHPFVRRGQTHHHQDGDRLDGLPYLPLRCLSASPSKAGKMCLASLCNRSTTRAPTDRSIPGRTTFVELTAHRTDTCSERPHGVLLPCGNRTPGGYALDGAFPTSAKPTQPCPQ